MSLPRIDRLVVFGVGLIGGSFALALRQAGAVREVIGIGRGEANLAEAVRRGIADRTYTAGWEREIAGADVVLLAVPVGQMTPVLRALAPHLGSRTLVTDAGSTKQDVIAAAQAEMGAALPRFVPAHPIAGTEHSGAAAAFATLFQGRNVILTPTARTAGDALMTIDALWALCGARVTCLDASRHDALFAAVSHLPHALAFALVNALATRPDGDDFFRQAASGFRDFTRLASSDAVMWRDICLANRAALRAELAAYRDELARFDDMLARSDADALAAYFRGARERRNAWLARQRGPGDESA